MSFAGKVGLRAAGVIATLAFCAAARADVTDFLGNWANGDSDAGGIARVLVMATGGNHVQLRVFGQCHPAECDWGLAAAHIYGADSGSHDVRSIAAEVSTSFARKTIILRKGEGDELRFEVLTNFTDGSGRQDTDVSGKLHRTNWGGPGGGWGGGPGGGWGSAGPGVGPGGGGWGGGPGGAPSPKLGHEDCIGLVPPAVMAAYAGGGWKLAQGATWLLDFGTNSAAAHRAADAIHLYRFDEQCFVARPNAKMMYFKHAGHMPSGNMAGQDCVGFSRLTAHVTRIGGNWKVVDGSLWLLDYGADKSAAERALGIIQHYHLSRQCFIQRPNAAMMYWLSQ